MAESVSVVNTAVMLELFDCAMLHYVLFPCYWKKCHLAEFVLKQIDQLDTHTI